MKTKAIIAGAVVIAILLLATIFFITARPSVPVVTVRHVRSVRSSDWVAATFEITNHTDQEYLVDALYVVARDGVGWPITGNFSSASLGPHRSETETFSITNLPTGSPLRLRMTIAKELPGLEGLALRLDLRFRHGQKNVSLNPFDKKSRVAKSTVILSDEFVEPQPEPTNKASSEN